MKTDHKVKPNVSGAGNILLGKWEESEHLLNNTLKADLGDLRAPGRPPLPCLQMLRYWDAKGLVSRGGGKRDIDSAIARLATDMRRAEQVYTTREGWGLGPAESTGLPSCFSALADCAQLCHLSADSCQPCQLGPGSRVPDPLSWER